MDNHNLINKLKTPASFESLLDKTIFFEKILVDSGMDRKSAAKLGNLYIDAVHECLFKGIDSSHVVVPEELKHNPELYKPRLLRALESQLIAYTWTQIYPRLPMSIIPIHARYVLVSPDCIDKQTQSTLQTITNNLLMWSYE
jgi:hypothetical protein